MAKGKVIQMPERGEQLTMEGINVGPKVSKRDGQVILRWLEAAGKDIKAYYWRAFMKKLEGWQCSCSCHRARQATYHCIGCADGKLKKVVGPVTL